MDQRTAYDRIRLRIAHMKTDVFLREDFADLASYTQVSRVIKRLTDEGVLYRLGYGVYARAHFNPVAGRVLPKGGVSTVKAAVRRLGVQTSPGQALQEYNAGSTQVPNGRTIRVDRRITRKLGYEDFQLRYERVQK